MELVLSAAVFCCALGVALAVVRPAPSDSVRLPAEMAGARRSSLWRVLASLGQAMPRWGRQQEEARGRLLYTGSRITIAEFGGLKFLSTAGGLAAVFVLLQELGSASPMWLGLGGLVGFLVPDAWLRMRVAKRQQAILRLLPEAIDLLSLCIGAGLDLLAALNKVVAINQFKFTRQPLMEEFSLALREIKLGKRRGEALRALAKRVNLPEMSSFVRMVVQAERMGTPLAQVLAVHSEDIRLERFMRAERAALQAPIKILGPLIFCIMPCVAIIVGAPIFLQFMKQSPFGR